MGQLEVAMVDPKERDQIGFERDMPEVMMLTLTRGAQG